MTLASKRKILIVEDNALNREILSALLQDEYDILTAENGEVGLDILAQSYRELSLVILDVYMPVCNGIEFLERIKDDALLSAVPVLVATGSEREEEEVKCLDLGAADFIVKPYNAKVVRARIHSIIKLRESVATLSVVEYDALTGLYTMPAFYHHATKILAEHPDESYDLVMSDIQEFKLINSIYGENAGNAILRYLAKQAVTYLPDGIAARQGDKLYCLYNAKNRKTTEEWNKMMQDCVDDAPLPNLIIKYGLYRDVDTSQSILILCDRVLMAVTTIKQDNTKKAVVYDDKIQQKRKFELKLEAEFEDALEAGDLTVWYQPKVDTKTEQIVASEALVRWIDKSGNIISPGDFIPLFERDGLIRRLDEYVFQKVCQFQKNRMDANMPIIPISVNLSRNSIFHKNTVKKYKEIVDQYKIPLEMVPLELTESAAIGGSRILVLAEQLVTEGFSLHMDDFGAGFSSLSSLSTMPFHVLKLDKALVDQIGNEKGDIILQYTIRIAQEMGMRVVAEGVEQKHQVDFLKSVGCDSIQGYYYAPPMAESAYTELLNQI